MRPIPGIRGTAAMLMRERDFRFIWGVGVLAEFGRRNEILVWSLLILQVVDAPVSHLMLLWVFNNLPRPFISPIAGYIADRFSRQRVMLLVQAANVITVAGLLALMIYSLESLQSWHVFAAAFIQGTTKAIEDPSRRTGIFDIAGRDRIVNAMSLDVIAQNVGKMIGPIVGGIIIELSGYQAAYIFLLFVHIDNLWLISRLRIPETGIRTALPPIWRGMGNAFSFAWSNGALVGMLSITIVMNAWAFPLQQFIPAVGTDLLDVGEALVGALVAADGFGHLAGAALMATRRGVRFHGRYFAFGSIIVLLASAAYVWSQWYELAFCLLLVSGLGQAGFSTMQSSIMMLVSPPAMRGQMMGLLSFCIGIANLAGAAELYFVVSALALQQTISLHALAALALLIPAMTISPLVRRPLPQTEPQTAP